MKDKLLNKILLASPLLLLGLGITHQYHTQGCITLPQVSDVCGEEARVYLYFGYLSIALSFGLIIYWVLKILKQKE